MECLTGGSTDPFFFGKPKNPYPEPPANQNAYDYLPSRPFRLLFDEFMLRYQTLEWIPFERHGYNVRWPDEKNPNYAELKVLFETYGWPENFDGEAFDGAAERWREFDDVRALAEEKADAVKNAVTSKDSIASHLLQHSNRFQNGLWDNDPDKSANEVKSLEKQLEGFPRFLEEAEKKLEKLVEELGVPDDHDVAMEKAWTVHLQRLVDYHTRNLEWYRGDGKVHAKDEEVKELEEEIEGIEARIRDVKALPKTYLEAIRPL